MIFIATYKRKLKDRSGNYVVPATRASCVYFDDNTTLSKLTFYPVGSIYQSVNETSPASLFGGDWERQYDRFLIGGGKTYKMGSEDGSATQALDIENLPGHTHMIGDPGWRLMIWDEPGIQDKIWVDAGYDQTTDRAIPLYYKWRDQYTSTIGQWTPHNNMPPYRAVAMWIRTA